MKIFCKIELKSEIWFFLLPGFNRFLYSLPKKEIKLNNR